MKGKKTPKRLVAEMRQFHDAQKGDEPLQGTNSTEPKRSEVDCHLRYFFMQANILVSDAGTVAVLTMFLGFHQKKFSSVCQHEC